jgi:adenylate kinase
MADAFGVFFAQARFFASRGIDIRLRCEKISPERKTLPKASSIYSRARAILCAQADFCYTTSMKKIIIVLYGAPGSGKGTQANLLARKLGLFHFDSGRFLESIVHDPKRQKEKIVERERKLFDGGDLNTPSFVFREVSREVRRLARVDWGIIFSGSLRTRYEAERLVPILNRLYGKKNIFVFELTVPPQSSVRRNSARLICKVCGYILLTAFYPTKHPKHCPVCAGPFYHRSLDNPKVMQERLREYEERTLPMVRFMKERGYPVAKIDAHLAPYKVLEMILKKLAVFEEKEK